MQLSLAAFVIAFAFFAIVGAEDPYRFFNWNVTYGDIYPLGVRQQVLIFYSSFSLVLMYYILTRVHDKNGEYCEII